MPIQKRTVLKSTRLAEANQPNVEANPLKAIPFAARTLAKKKTKKTGGFTATTMVRRALMH